MEGLWSSDLEYRALPCPIVLYKKQWVDLACVPFGYLEVDSNENEDQRREISFHFSNVKDVHFKVSYS
jgi:hypothetical protein